nr:hypothetical protein 5 [Gammaproteobacteria bacterium]
MKDFFFGLGCTSLVVFALYALAATGMSFALWDITYFDLSVWDTWARAILSGVTIWGGVCALISGMELNDYRRKLKQALCSLEEEKQLRKLERQVHNESTYRCRHFAV